MDNKRAIALGFFDGVHIGHCALMEACRKAAEKLKAKPEECLVLEDSQTGIEAAVRAHMSVICIPDMKKPDDEHLKQTIAVKEDLLSVIDFLQQ